MDDVEDERRSKQRLENRVGKTGYKLLITNRIDYVTRRIEKFLNFPRKYDSARQQAKVLDYAPVVDQIAFNLYAQARTKGIKSVKDKDIEKALVDFYQEFL